MFFVALATDYDGTLAHQGRVDEAAREALAEVRRSGRKLILVTGRELDDLASVFPSLESFDLIVAENGGLLFDPATKEEIALAAPPPPALVARLEALAVEPLSVGRTIIATREPNEAVVLQAIRDLSLELHIIFNKGAVMVLPSNVNKASGLEAALERLALSPHNVVGIGDAENDLTFLAACGCAVAVENALPTVKEEADLVVADHGHGVIELARMLVGDDLASAGVPVPRAQLVLGERKDGRQVMLSPFETVLVTGASGGGKSTLVTALLERMREHRYQFCVVDPEGDYDGLEGGTVIGDARQVPRTAEALELLAKPDINVALNLLAIDPVERPRFLAAFLPDVARLRMETGRPHWIVLDEVHHCLPTRWDPAPVTLPRELPAAIAITVHPDEVASDFLELVTTVVGIGSGAREAISAYCRASRRGALASGADPRPGEALVLGRDGELAHIVAPRPKDKQKRHVRKYSEGELGEDKSFYFRGAQGALNLRAQNLLLFLQIAAGVDDDTWLHHLRQGDYSRWFREAIKDEELAREAADVEQERSLSPADSRARIKEMVERRYTAPAKRD